MGLTAAAIALGATAVAVGTVGTGYGIYNAIEANNIADEANDLTKASMLDQASEAGKAQAKTEMLEEQALNATAKKAEQAQIENDALQKRKRGVQSTFTTIGSGAGNLKGTTLSPLGE